MTPCLGGCIGPKGLGFDLPQSTKWLHQGAGTGAGRLPPDTSRIAGGGLRCINRGHHPSSTYSCLVLRER